VNTGVLDSSARIITVSAMTRRIDGPPCAPGRVRKMASESLVFGRISHFRARAPIAQSGPEKARSRGREPGAGGQRSSGSQNLAASTNCAKSSTTDFTEYADMVASHPCAPCHQCHPWFRGCWNESLWVA
jgi:hypothetical protein